MIVFNSSTLILLAKAELLDTFLAALNDKVVIPKQVETECCEEKQSVDALLIRKVIQEKKIFVQPLKNKRLYGKILTDFPLGKGEAESLALAVSQKARLFATDDKRAIQASTDCFSSQHSVSTCLTLPRCYETNTRPRRTS